MAQRAEALAGCLGFDGLESFQTGVLSKSIVYNTVQAEQAEVCYLLKTTYSNHAPAISSPSTPTEICSRSVVATERPT